MEQQMELVKAKQELQAAIEKLSLQEKLTRRGPANYYYLGEETDPLCPVCWERDRKVIHLPRAEPWSGGIRRDCHVCSTVHWDKPRPADPDSDDSVDYPNPF